MFASKNKSTNTSFCGRRVIFVCLLLSIATSVVYWQVNNHEFINLDDARYVAENPQVQRGLSHESVIWAFTATDMANWHPLTWLSHMLDFQLYGLNPTGHHLTNVVFHLLNTLLLFLVLQRMTGGLWRSGFVAALFALHPLHVESVAWVAERKDVLSTLFWMLTLWAYLGYVKRPGVKKYLLLLVPFALGLMAKPMLVTLPFVLLLLDYWPLERIQLGQAGISRTAPGPPAIIAHTPRRQAFRLLLEKTPFFALAAVSGFVTFVVQKSGGAVGALEVYPVKIRVANALVSYVRYMAKMIWPQNLAVFYPHPGQSLPMWQAAAAGLLLLLISTVVIRAGRRQPYLPVGWFWYLGTLVPVIGLVQVGAQAMADRYTYVPLIGLFIMVAWGSPHLVARLRYRRIFLTLAAGTVLSVFMILTGIQLHHWKNSSALFQHALRVTSNNHLAHNNLGNVLARQGKTKEAIGHYARTLQISPNFPNAHNNLGKALARQGKTEESIGHYLKALQLKPDLPEAHNNLGNALARQGKDQEAIDHYTKALQLKPNFAGAHNNLGNVLERQGRRNDALYHYSMAIQLKPDFGDAYFNLGTLLAQQGKSREAIAQFSQALQVEPDSAEAHNSLGALLARQGELSKAIEHFRDALRIKPGFRKAQRNLQIALQEVARGGEAQESEDKQ